MWYDEYVGIGTRTKKDLGRTVGDDFYNPDEMMVPGMRKRLRKPLRKRADDFIFLNINKLYLEKEGRRLKNDASKDSDFKIYVMIMGER